MLNSDSNLIERLRKKIVDDLIDERRFVDLFQYLIFMNSFILFNKSSRTKRNVARFNLFVEFLAVVDSGFYNYFVNLYGSNVPASLITDYISIYFTQLINGVIFSIIL